MFITILHLHDNANTLQKRNFIPSKYDAQVKNLLLHFLKRKLKYFSQQKMNILKIAFILVVIA